MGGAEGARTPDPKTARSLRGKKTRIVATLWCAFRSRTWQEAQPSRNRLGGRASLRRPPKSGDQGIKIKILLRRAAPSNARNPRVANHSPTPRLLATTLAAVATVCSLADASLIRNQQITWILWTGYSRKPGCSWFPAGQPGAALGGRTGSLRLSPSRQPGSTDDARHQTIAHLPTVG